METKNSKVPDASPLQCLHTLRCVYINHGLINGQSIHAINIRKARSVISSSPTPPIFLPIPPCHTSESIKVIYGATTSRLLFNNIF